MADCSAQVRSAERVVFAVRSGNAKADCVQHGGKAVLWSALDCHSRAHGGFGRGRELAWVRYFWSGLD